MGLIAQNFDPALWSVSLPSIFSGFGRAGFWIGVPQIALVNVVLSGDTAVVIALACRGLPPARRPRGIAVGAGTAALLLLIFAVIVAPLLAYPYVKLIGGSRSSTSRSNSWCSAARARKPLRPQPICRRS